MSDAVSAPAAPVAAPAPPPSSADATAPVASTQPPLTISEAARLLSSQRRTAQGQQPAAPSAPAQAAQAPAQAATAPAQAAQAPSEAPPAAELSAMDRSLGLTPNAAQAAPDAAAAVELDGSRYSHEQLRELIRRGSDYTKKTQEVAAQARALREQQAQLATVLPYLQPEIERLTQMVQDIPLPDDRLVETDPQGYLRQKANYDRLMAEQQRLGAIQQVQQQASQRLLMQQVEAANAQLTQEFPWWGDPVERDKARAQIVDWATTKGGFSRQELATLADARQLKALMKASAFDRWVAQAKTSAPANGTAAPARGSAPAPAPTERLEQAEARFAEKPDWRAGAALLAARRAR